MDAKTKNGHENGGQKEESDLFKIEVPSENPFDLFKLWYKQAEDAGVIMPHALNLATSDGSGRVSSRTLLMRRLLDDGFLIMTDSRSKKSFDLSKCPRVAVTFLWMYPRSPSGIFAQQVRVEGFVSEVSFDKYSDLYASEPLYCKIRSKICRQGEFVNWDEHKKSHDQVYKQYLEQGISSLSQIPDHYVMYKVHPEMFDFYMATDATIGNRVTFRLAEQTHLIPAEALDKKTPKDADAALEETFRNGLKIASGPGEVDTKNGPREWVHYNVCA